MAALVTCSWPRAELTALSHAHSRQLRDLLARQLANAASNRERAIAVASALRGGRTLATKHPADAAAAARMTALSASPQRSLHAYLADRVLPLTLAARAETRLAAGPRGTAQITDLLEQDALAA